MRIYIHCNMLPITAVWIDAETDLVNSMTSFLKDGDRVQHLADGSPDSLEKVLWSAVDLVLLELKLGQNFTFDLIPEIRKKKSSLPIVIVTAFADKQNCLTAINLGVNGMIEKPLTENLFKELIERHRCKGFELKMCEDRKAILSQGDWVDLTSTEYKIIETLKASRRRLTRAELQAAVWPNSSISENNLDTHLTNLKRKIPELAACLNVKRGLGYFLDTKKPIQTVV